MAEPHSPKTGVSGALSFRGACGNLFEAGTPNFGLGKDPRLQGARHAPTGSSSQATQPVATAVPRPDTSDHRGIRGRTGLPTTRNTVQHLGTQRAPTTTPRGCRCSRALTCAPPRLFDTFDKSTPRSAANSAYAELADGAAPENRKKALGSHAGRPPTTSNRPKSANKLDLERLGHILCRH
jgi:hypothetical protein